MLKATLTYTRGTLIKNSSFGVNPTLEVLTLVLRIREPAQAFLLDYKIALRSSLTCFSYKNQEVNTLLLKK
ncbi:hypothetical protein M23134_03168 [Microscilla marina ATCC 23134]|uniref:Uncharacterized protein n=1 Tax=Microscilla marina ATCC 23134 TaxID=313606 RepID=A1ZGB5_MICM2|nr:hypothetical protein M23134_03168 [Microscilla marina ATCC 23134]